MGTFGNAFGKLNRGRTNEVPLISDLSLFYQGYDNGYIREQSGLDAQIVKYPGMSFGLIDGKSPTLRYIDNSLFDINTTGEITLSAWVRTGTDITSVQYILGKLIADSVIGRYGIYINASKFYASCQTSVGFYTIASSTISTNTLYHLLVTYKINDKFHFYINNVESGTGTSITTIANLDNKYKFWVGGGNSAAGDGTQFFSGNVSDVRIFNSVLSSVNIAKCYTKSIIGEEMGYWPLNDFSNIGYTQKFFDISGNNRHLQSSGYDWASTKWTYYNNGNNHDIVYGYDIYGAIKSITALDRTFIYIPHKTDGTSVTVVIGTDVPASFVKFQTVAGSTSIYNMSPAVIDFNPTLSVDSRLDILDRSDTVIQTATSRASTIYNVATPYQYSSLELNINVLKGYFNTDYKWRVFPKISNNSIYYDEIYKFDELLIYPTQRTSKQKLEILRYTNDYNKFYTYSNTYSDGYFAAVNYKKVLKCDDAGGLSLSTDGGITFGSILDVSNDFLSVVFSHIFDNGNILFSSKRKMFLSTDNLNSYHQINVYDINGNIYTPPDDNQFLTIGYTKGNINNKEILLWGNYGFSSPNIWMSSDNGESVRLMYKFGTSSPLVYADHVHGVHYNPIDNSFWIQTGDAPSGGNNQANWLKGVYNSVLDTFTFTYINGDDGNYLTSLYKTVGFSYYNGYMYWGNDISGGLSGVTRVSYTDVLDNTKFEVMVSSWMSLGMIGDNIGLILVPRGTLTKQLVVSVDGKHFDLFTNTGGVTINDTYQYLLNPRGPTSTGYYIVDQVKVGDIYPFFQNTEVLMMKIDKNN